MGTQTSKTAAEVIKAIKGTAGVKTTIAKKLGVSRQTVDSYLARWSTVREAYEEEKAGVDDAAVSVIINDIINNKDVGTAKWWVARKLDEFADKQRVILNLEDLAAREGVPLEAIDKLLDADADTLAQSLFGEQ